MSGKNSLEHVTIDLTPDVFAALEQKANGQDIKLYIQQIVRKQALRPNLDELLSPVRKEFAESGLSEDELDGFLASVRTKAFQERNNERSGK